MLLTVYDSQTKPMLDKPVMRPLVQKVIGGPLLTPRIKVCVDAH